ncbi:MULTISPECIES: glycoside hydrolase family 97 protein [unclassified Sphingobacterium]|uniref:glycoside hydrolase family 97 protein n=1 Tax=unclassified Sphingobacterium TaxID=2609468 RepID=UPI0020C52D53|nr:MULTISPECIES: glycoside hydrolase family 97 protein [unclassified Sphingobacterium]
MILTLFSNSKFCMQGFFLLIVALSIGQAHAQLESPNGKIKVDVQLNEMGEPSYAVKFEDVVVLESSKLGLMVGDESFSSGLSLVNRSKVNTVNKSYESLNAKRRINKYQANEQLFSYINKQKHKFNIRFQVSNDGVVFRYEIPQIDHEKRLLKSETSSFKFPKTTIAWLQPMAIAKSGWEQTNPSYEEHYYQEIKVGTVESTRTGWVYPALFKVGETYALISESGLEANHAASRLDTESENAEYKIAYAGIKETIMNKELETVVEGDFQSPWRVIAIGTLGTLVESTLGLDILDPAIQIDQSFIKPGKASWSWINSKDEYIIFDEQKKYIDFAADMNWQYCLIDVNWDRNIGYEKIQELADYAKEKKVSLILWYNSAGDWNTVGYTPKNKLLTSESRRKEFAKLHEMGIKGVKIDFFGGDGKSVIAYYHEILRDAADYKLLVNFHGATLPRGWSKMYPHLMTVEAVRGFETVTFTQEDADRQAEICATLPFTRNVFDPMDYTPMNLFKVNANVKRKTTSAFELATSILFLSGIQHYAESPEGMAHVPEYIKQFLRDLPSNWDDVKFIQGYPGKEVVIARKSGNKWYMAGINGENMEKKMTINLSGLATKGMVKLITDGNNIAEFSTQEFDVKDQKSITVRPNGGFVMILD